MHVATVAVLTILGNVAAVACGRALVIDDRRMVREERGWVWEIVLMAAVAERALVARFAIRSLARGETTVIRGEIASMRNAGPVTSLTPVGLVARRAGGHITETMVLDRVRAVRECEGPGGDTIGR